MKREIKGTVKLVYTNNDRICARTVFQIREISMDDETYDRVKASIQAKLKELRADNKGYWFDAIITDTRSEFIQ